MAKPLPPRRAAFVREYLKDLNATQAAIRAGYSAKTAHATGHELLSFPEVAAEVQAAMTERAQRVQVSADDVLRELLRLATVDVSKAFGPDGELLSVHAMPEDVRRAIASVDSCEEKVEGVAVGTLRKVRFWDKPKALEMLGRHLKLFADRLEHSGPDGGALQVQVSINGIRRE